MLVISEYKPYILNVALQTCANHQFELLITESIMGLYFVASNAVTCAIVDLTVGSLSGRLLLRERVKIELLFLHYFVLIFY